MCTMELLRMDTFIQSDDFNRLGAIVILIIIFLIVILLILGQV